MTLNPRASRLRAPRLAGVGTRPRRRRALGVAGALAALVSLVLVPPSATATTGDEAFVFTMAPRGDGVVEPGQSLLVSLAADNRMSTAVRGGEVDVAMGRMPLSARSEVTAWLGADRPEIRLDQLADVSIDVIPPFGERTIDVVIDADDLGGDDLAPGVYPLLATYTSENRVETSAAVITVPEDSDEPAGSVAVVVPITAGPTGAGLLTADELALLTGSGGTLRELLDAVTGTSAILAVDPAIPAAIRVLGTRAPDSAVMWLEDLVALSNERFALQFGDADLAAQVNAGLSRPLTVPTLAPYLDPQDFTGLPEQTPETPTPTPTSSPTPDAGAPGGQEESPLPDTDTLLAVGPTAGTVLWPATGTAGADVVAALGAAVSDETPLVMVPSDASSPASGPRATAGEAELLVYDAEVSAALLTASTTVGDVARNSALAAATAFAELAPDDRTLLVTVDRGTARTGAALRDALSTVTNLPGRETVGFAEVTAESATRAEIAQVEPEAARVAAFGSLRDGESELSAFATILEDATLITGPERASILQLMGNGWREAPAAWTSALNAHTAATAQTLDAVGIVPPSDQILLGSSAPMRIAIRNDLPWPVSLVLLAHPNDPRLVVQSTTPVDAGPEQNTLVEVPVEARVGSGESSLDLRLRSPTMVAIGDEARVEVSVRAEWEGIGIAVMAVAIGGMLTIGVLRTVSRVRARRRARAAGGDAAGDTGDGAVDAGDTAERDDV